MRRKALVTQHTALCGVVLHPASHTRSPAMHNAAFAALGLDAVYLAFDVRPQALPAAVAGWRALGGRQLSVSIPHKVAILPLLVVLGAGGTARAVVYGLLARGAKVWILNRTAERAQQLCEALGAGGAGPLSELRHTPHDVLVNTTSVGLGDDASPVEAEAIADGAVVLDAVYVRSETRLLRDARGRGGRAVAGKWMLVHQAAAQLEAWSGRTAPVDVMAAAFDAAG